VEIFRQFQRKIWEDRGQTFDDFEFVEGLVGKDGEGKEDEEFEFVEGSQAQEAQEEQGAQDVAPNSAASRAQAQTLTQQQALGLS